MRFARMSMISLAVLMSGCGDLDTNASDPIEGDASGEQATAENDDGTWHVTTSTDPINDKSYVTATARLSGADHSFDVEVSCINGSLPQYKFAATQYGIGVPFKLRKRPASLFSVSEQSISYQARVDQLPAQWLFVSPSANDNEIVHTGASMESPLLGHDFINYLPLAKTLTLRFFLDDGEDTIVIGQTQGGIAKVIKPCADAFQARIDEGKRNEAKQRPAPTAASSDEPSQERPSNRPPQSNMPSSTPPYVYRRDESEPLEGEPDPVDQ